MNHEEALLTVGFNALQNRLLLVSGLSFAACTTQLLLPSILFPLISGNLSRLGHLSASLFGGEIVGALTFSRVSDLKGRKHALLLANALLCLFSCLYTQDTLFCLFRFLTGVGVGGCLSLEFSYCMEMIPAEMRRSKGTLISLLGIGGLAYLALISRLTDDPSFVVALTGLPFILIFLLRLIWSVESSGWLYSQGRLEECERVLSRINPVVRVKLNKPCEIKASNTGLNSKDIVFGSLILACHSTAYYGLTNWRWKIAEVAGFKKASPGITLLLTALFEVPGLFFTQNFISKRQKMLLVLNLVSAVIFSSATLFSCNQTFFIFLSSLTYFWIVGIWTCLYVLIPLKFPIETRTRSFAVCKSFARVASFGSSFLIPRLSATSMMGVFVSLWLFATILTSFYF